ncbi:hypothetical protein [Nonomuraea sp. SYSU D8015]|uniref:hypothetical protein n=1 Tax=Nonomuraea sp. SYSU D8015 TaxID=2593644 RepID=UPI0016607FB5|nr:hypothetical protein [Nonomuraea sp. SYSU D8015]
MTNTAPSARRRLTPFTVLAALFAISLVCLAVPGIGPGVRAATADGTPGTFVARELTCVRHPGHESCTWTGDFRPYHGAGVKSGVELYGRDRDTLRAGEQTAAIDVGRPHRVYEPGGSNEWMFSALLLLCGLTILGFLLRTAARAIRP